jgi:hypothetical protein
VLGALRAVGLLCLALSSSACTLDFDQFEPGSGTDLNGPDPSDPDQRRDAEADPPNGDGGGNVEPPEGSPDGSTLPGDPLVDSGSGGFPVVDGSVLGADAGDPVCLQACENERILCRGACAQPGKCLLDCDDDATMCAAGC